MLIWLHSPDLSGICHHWICVNIDIGSNNWLSNDFLNWTIMAINYIIGFRHNKCSMFTSVIFFTLTHLMLLLLALMNILIRVPYFWKTVAIGDTNFIRTWTYEISLHIFVKFYNLLSLLYGINCWKKHFILTFGVYDSVFFVMIIIIVENIVGYNFLFSLILMLLFTLLFKIWDFMSCVALIFS